MKWASSLIRRRSRLALVSAIAVLAGPATVFALPGAASAVTTLVSGDLLVSTSQWAVNPNITSGTTQLPPNCGGTTYPDATCATANAGGQYPQVFKQRRHRWQLRGE
jgi:hypothetical protein